MQVINMHTVNPLDYELLSYVASGNLLLPWKNIVCTADGRSLRFSLCRTTITTDLK